MRRLPWIVLVLAACGGKATPSTPVRGSNDTVDEAQVEASKGFPTRAPFARPGEVMTYTLSMHDVEVAAFTVAVGEPTRLEGRDVVVVQSGVRTTGLAALVRQVEDTFTSWLDAGTTLPVLFRADELASAEDATVERTDAEVWGLAEGTFPVRVTRPDLGEVVETQSISEHPLYDLNGFLMMLRSWEPEPGSSLPADVIRSRWIWRTEVTMVGYTTVTTALGEVGALEFRGASKRVQRNGEIDPKSDTRTYGLWISDDADRVPVLMVAHTDYGDLRMELVQYTPGS